MGEQPMARYEKPLSLLKMRLAALDVPQDETTVASCCKRA